MQKSPFDVDIVFLSFIKKKRRNSIDNHAYRSSDDDAAALHLWRRIQPFHSFYDDFKDNEHQQNSIDERSQY